MVQTLIYFVAGIAGGIVNSPAGGAKLFVFPMLLAAGLSPLGANATAAVAMWPAQLPSVWVNRRDLMADPRAMVRLVLPAMVGSFLGALALIASPEETFVAIVPFLLAIAVGAILLGRRLSLLMQRAFPGGRLERAAQVMMAVAGFYGGYFGAGVGFMIIAVLSVAGLALRQVITVKNVAAFSLSSVAVIPLSLSGLVDWYAAGTVLIGGLIGGWLGGYVVRWVPEAPMRYGVAVLGVVMVVSFLFV